MNNFIELQKYNGEGSVIVNISQISVIDVETYKTIPMIYVAGYGGNSGGMIAITEESAKNLLILFNYKPFTKGGK